MQSSRVISVPRVGEIIRGRISELGISQMELAARVGEHFQTISAIINGRREATVPLSVRMDEALGFSPGTLALAQTRYQVEKEVAENHPDGMNQKRQLILEKIKANGGFWSYQGLPDSLAQYDAAVLYGMVAVHLQIPLAVEGQIKEPVPCKAAQHVVEKAYARIDVIDPSSVQGDGAGDIRLSGLSGNGSGSVCHNASSRSETDLS